MGKLVIFLNIESKLFKEISYEIVSTPNQLVKEQRISCKQCQGMVIMITFVMHIICIRIIIRKVSTVEKTFLCIMGR